jgi:hypothetical protein
VAHRVIRILDEGINSEKGKVGLTLGVVNQVQIHELLQFQVICGEFQTSTCRKPCEKDSRNNAPV